MTDTTKRRVDAPVYLLLAHISATGGGGERFEKRKDTRESCHNCRFYTWSAHVESGEDYERIVRKTIEWLCGFRVCWQSLLHGVNTRLARRAGMRVVSWNRVVGRRSREIGEEWQIICMGYWRRGLWRRGHSERRWNNMNEQMPVTN